jgi:hypothetical protein
MKEREKKEGRNQKKSPYKHLSVPKKLMVAYFYVSLFFPSNLNEFCVKLWGWEKIVQEAEMRRMA